MSPNRPKYWIPASDSYDLAHANYFSSGKPEAFRKAVNERRFRVSRTDVSYRTMSHWEREGLLPDGIEQTDGWRNFSLVEVFWLEIVKRLRNFGVSLEMIGQAKRGIARWDSKRQCYPDLEFHIWRALRTQSDDYAVVFPDGEALIANTQEISAYKNIAGWPQDMLLVSFKDILAEKGHMVEEAQAVFTLTPAELEALAAIRIGGNKSIKVRIGEKGISELEMTKNSSEPLSDSSIKEELGKDGIFGEVTTRYTDGRQRSTEIRTTKRFKGHRASGSAPLSE